MIEARYDADGNERCPGQRLGLDNEFGKAHQWDVLQTIIDKLREIEENQERHAHSS